jgi:hypothetical protein
MNQLLSSLIAILIATTSFCQEKVLELGLEGGKISHHQFSFMLSHSYISEGYFFSSRKWIAAPSFGLDYNYWVKKNLAIGIHTDLIKENFALEEASGDKIIERSTPFAIVPALTYKPGEHGALILGMGGEFAKEGSFAVTRVGYEYGWELPKKYELAFSLTYDLKWNAYNTWTFGLVVSKFFK